MTKLRLDSTVSYIRDAQKLPNTDQVRLGLPMAVQKALAEHKAGETPMIVGSNLNLVGIDAIRAMRDAGDLQLE